MSSLAVFFYTYQNIISCYRFYGNIYLITDNINCIKEYSELTLKNIDLILFKIKNLSSYKKFSIELDMYRDKLYKFHKTITTKQCFKNFVSVSLPPLSKFKGFQSSLCS